jgi:tripartite-type tricarboxylate transporter receptor subunit TctC
MRFLSIAAMILAMAAPAAGAAETEYPAREVTLIVPFAAGGPTDIVARIVADSMSNTLGQQITIENVVGAGGTTAATRTMRAAADGYTIMMGHMGTHAAAVALYPNLAYNPKRDFAPIGVVAGMPVLILARQHLPVATFQDFTIYARKWGSELRMAHAGIGSVAYTACTLLNQILDVRPTMVAYQGTGPAMDALVAGEVDYMCDQIVSVVPQVRAGTILALAISTPERSPALSKVPTTGEAGIPEFQVSAWNALFAPKGTPQPVIDKLNRALAAALDDPATHKRLVDLGSVPPEGDARSPAALAALVDSEIVKWSALTRPSDEAKRDEAKR